MHVFVYLFLVIKERENNECNNFIMPMSMQYRYGKTITPISFKKYDYYIISIILTSELSNEETRINIRCPGIITLEWVITPSADIKRNYERFWEMAPTNSAQKDFRSSESQTNAKS